MYQIFKKQNEGSTPATYDYNTVFKVKFINTVKTSVFGRVKSMFVADGFCHLFVQDSRASAANAVQWYKFDATSSYHTALLESKCDNNDFTFNPSLVQMEYSINPNGEWFFKAANRDLSKNFPSFITDAFFVECRDGNKDLWYLSALDGYIYTAPDLHIADMAYEQHKDTLYVIYEGDNHLYKYDNLKTFRNAADKLTRLQKETATMKLETFHTIDVTSKTMEWMHLFIDYADANPSDLTDSEKTWTIRLIGTVNDGERQWIDVETLGGNPGSQPELFQQYNIIYFGDTLFNESQLKFQNISKNKEMFDILDIDEVDNCYYGLFKDITSDSDDKYVVFKTTTSGVVQKLPYDICIPQLCRT